MGIQVHKILEGPFDSVDETGREYWWVEAMITEGNIVKQTTLSSYDFDNIYKIVRHMKSPTIEPYHTKEDFKGDF